MAANYFKLVLMTGLMSILNPVSLFRWILYSITRNYLALIDLYEYQTYSLVYRPHLLNQQDGTYERVAPRPLWLDEFLTEVQRRQATLS
jgi:hypothetical protein